jgi:hypothetical protein
MHHNLFVKGRTRNPQAQWDATLATAPPDLVLDFRNNLVWDFSGYGTLVRRKATANVVSNYYHSSSRSTARHALVFDMQARVHAAGNRGDQAPTLDPNGTEAEFPAVAVATTDACRAAQELRDGVGARGPNFGLDPIDRDYVGHIPSQLPGCPGRASAPAAGSAERDVLRSSRQ